MTNLHGDTAQEAAKLADGETVILRAQIAAIEQKCTTTLALLDQLWDQLFYFGLQRMKDVKKNVDYNLCINLDQIGDIKEVLLWWKHTRDWDLTARRAFEAAWTVHSIASADRARVTASNAITGATNRLYLLKATVAPYDDLLSGLALYEVMHARKARMQDPIQDILAKELQEAETALTEYCDVYLSLQKKVDEPLLIRYLDGDETTRKDIMDAQWNMAFASAPKPEDPDEVPASSKDLDTISVLVQLPFFAELYFMRSPLEKAFQALGGKIAEKDGGGEVIRAQNDGEGKVVQAERTVNIKQRAADAAAAAAQKMNMMLAERPKAKKVDDRVGGKPAKYAVN